MTRIEVQILMKLRTSGHLNQTGSRMPRGRADLNDTGEAPACGGNQAAQMRE